MNPPPWNDFPGSSSSSLPSLPPSRTIFPLDSDYPGPERDEALARYLVNCFDPMVNMNTESYVEYGPEGQHCETRSTSLPQPGVPWAEALADDTTQQPATYLVNHLDPSLNFNSYTGYGPEIQQSRTLSTSSTRSAMAWADAVADDTVQQRATYLVNRFNPSVNLNSYIRYGHEIQQSQMLSTLPTRPAIVRADALMDGAVQQPATYHANHFNPSVDLNSYTGHGHEIQQSQTPSTSSAQPVMAWADTIVAETARQPQPQYPGTQHEIEMDPHPYRPPTPILDSHSAGVMAGNLPVIPLMEGNQWPPSVSGNSGVPVPLTTVPWRNEGSDYLVEQPKHFAAPTLASARGTNILEATTSHRTFAGTRSSPYAYPPAENKNQGTRKKRQVVSEDDPLAHAISRALDREIEACKVGVLECGPCYLQREHELTDIRKSVEHEILYMLIYFDPPARQLRVVASEIRKLFGRSVRNHLLQPTVAMDHPCQRTTRPGHWERNFEIPQDVDPEHIVFTRKAA